MFFVVVVFDSSFRLSHLSLFVNNFFNFLFLPYRFKFVLSTSCLRQLIYISIYYLFCQDFFQTFFHPARKTFLLFLTEFLHSKSLLCMYHIISMQYKRRRRDLNPRAATNDLLPFQGSPFGQLGYFSINDQIQKEKSYRFNRYDLSGEGGIRTHAPLRTNGFQDRLVMTTSIPLHILLCRFFDLSFATSSILSQSIYYVNTIF